MRLFIAIELPRSFKQELARVQKEVKQMSCGGRFVPQENFHITLHLGKYDCFDKNGSKTSFLHVKGELDELDRLYESLQSALYDNGFSRERKRFRPHITLGRNVEHDELVTEELKRLSPNASMTVQGITLFESARQEGKVVYNPLHRERF